MKTEQFKEGILDEFLPNVDNKADSIAAGKRETLNIQGQNFPLNYRDGRDTV